MSRRAPSAPPELPGYEVEKLLGSGGFADVFLYRQFRPQRRVAIKVLLANVLDESVRRQFDAEADVMATMSTHPSIVTIYQADISTAHRPYIVMEYCPRPNYGVRFRRERIGVAEALRTGVQIAGAVETAHRAGILHRDIKPANILVTEYNRPALTDFGISIATSGAADFDDSAGMSIPWSPPEFFADPPRADVRSDVFSLASTVYSLLAGRTPFEHAGQRNSAADLISRIMHEPLARPDRPDVPEELVRVLSIAMAKDPVGRYDSALAFGRALQQIERAMGLPVTAMDVLDDRGEVPDADGSGEDDIDQHTRIRAVTTVDDSSPTGENRKLDPLAGVAPPLEASLGSGSRALPEDTADSTLLRPAGQAPAVPGSGADPIGTAAQQSSSTAAEETQRGAPAWPWVLLATVLVLAVGVGAMFTVRTLAPVEKPTIPVATSSDPMIGGDDDISAPAKVTVATVRKQKGTTPGKAQISWPQPKGFTTKDSYQVQWKDVPGDYDPQYSEPHEVKGRSSVVLDVPPGLKKTCAKVRIIRKDGQASPWTTGCLPTK